MSPHPCHRLEEAFDGSSWNFYVGLPGTPDTMAHTEDVALFRVIRMISLVF